MSCVTQANCVNQGTGARGIAGEYADASGASTESIRGGLTDKSGEAGGGCGSQPAL